MVTGVDYLIKKYGLIDEGYFSKLRTDKGDKYKNVEAKDNTGVVSVHFEDIEESVKLNSDKTSEFTPKVVEGIEEK